MLNKPRELVTMNQVPADKSKFKFTIQFNGEWDFNNDLAGNKFDDCALAAYGYANSPEFKAAFVKYITDRIFNDSTVSNFFESYATVKFEHSKEIEESYQDLRERIANAQKVAKQKKLAELEAQAEKIRKELK